MSLYHSDLPRHFLNKSKGAPTHDQFVWHHTMPLPGGARAHLVGAINPALHKPDGYSATITHEAETADGDLNGSILANERFPSESEARQYLSQHRPSGAVSGDEYERIYGSTKKILDRPSTSTEDILSRAKQFLSEKAVSPGNFHALMHAGSLFEPKRKVTPSEIKSQFPDGHLVDAAIVHDDPSKPSGQREQPIWIASSGKVPGDGAAEVGTHAFRQDTGMGYGPLRTYKISGHHTYDTAPNHARPVYVYK